MKNFYTIFDIDQSATQDQISKQYKLLVHAWHPDKFPEGELRNYAENMLKDINEAYSTLRNPSSRAIYDSNLNDQNDSLSHFDPANNNSRPKSNSVPNNTQDTNQTRNHNYQKTTSENKYPDQNSDKINQSDISYGSGVKNWQPDNGKLELIIVLISIIIMVIIAYPSTEDEKVYLIGPTITPQQNKNIQIIASDSTNTPVPKPTKFSKFFYKLPVIEFRDLESLAGKYILVDESPLTNQEVILENGIEKGNQLIEESQRLFGWESTYNLSDESTNFPEYLFFSTAIYSKSTEFENARNRGLDYFVDQQNFTEIKPNQYGTFNFAYHRSEMYRNQNIENYVFIMYINNINYLLHYYGPKEYIDSDFGNLVMKDIYLKIKSGNFSYYDYQP